MLQAARRRFRALPTTTLVAVPKAKAVAAMEAGMLGVGAAVAPAQIRDIGLWLAARMEQPA